jgi:hypothetical protein
MGHSCQGVALCNPNQMIVISRFPNSTPTHNNALPETIYDFHPEFRGFVDHLRLSPHASLTKTQRSGDEPKFHSLHLLLLLPLGNNITR